jgi:carboxypeptidase C (cathepsin A)
MIKTQKIVVKAYVYLLHTKFGNTNMYKIGMTTGSIESRIKSLQTGCPTKISIVTFGGCESKSHAITLEKFLHLQYKDLKLVGEWFSLPNSVVKDIHVKLKMLSSLDVWNMYMNYKEKIKYANPNATKRMRNKEIEEVTKEIEKKKLKSLLHKMKLHQPLIFKF